MITRVAGYLAVGVIIVLSLLPGNERPHTGASGHIEHITAYFITMFLLAAGHPQRRQQIIALCLLSICAGLMEIAQINIPGRTASIGDAVVSSIGAGFGLVAYLLLSLKLSGGRRESLAQVRQTRDKS